MKRIILGAFKRYNANTKDVNKGDCTVRAMSLAYGIEYESVYKELKQIQKEHGRTFYNTRPNLIDFIDRHGGSQITLNESITVEEFSERYNSGTYLLLTSKTPDSRIHHMIVSIDGDIYDSWNSLREYVGEAYMITDAVSHLYGDEFDITEAAMQIWEPLQTYINTQNQKTDVMYVDLNQLTTKSNDTVLIELRCHLDENVSPHSKFRKSAIIHQKFIAKFNLKKTQEENVKSLIPKLRTKIYDWMYNIRKDLEDSKKSESVLRDDFYGDRIVAVKLPEWSYPFLRYATSNGFSYKFEAEIDALDGDPRKSEAPSVRFYADSLRELKQQFANYKADFSRYGYDY